VLEKRFKDDGGGERRRITVADGDAEYYRRTVRRCNRNASMEKEFVLKLMFFVLHTVEPTGESNVF
jgi:hypothetical protein